jgi:hypothetical protein
MDHKLIRISALPVDENFSCHIARTFLRVAQELSRQARANLSNLLFLFKVKKDKTAKKEPEYWPYTL